MVTGLLTRRSLREGQLAVAAVQRDHLIITGNSRQRQRVKVAEESGRVTLYPQTENRGNGKWGQTITQVLPLMARVLKGSNITATGTKSSKTRVYREY